MIRLALIFLGILCFGLRADAAITTPHDTIPDFCQNPVRQSARSGNWSDPNTWAPAGVPLPGESIGIGSAHSVVYDLNVSPRLNCVGINGALTFRTDLNTQLWATNIIVYSTGQLTIGTSAQPISVNNTAEIILANQPLNAGTDPDQYGNALITFGKLVMHGAVKSPTFVRVSTEPKAGNTTLLLAQPASGWRVGDRIVIPDTRHIKDSERNGWLSIQNQWEERTVQSISPDGLSVGLNSGLTFDHLGARDSTGHLDFLPHVGNLSRNVVIRSESPTGTRGHTLSTYRSDTDIRYTLFKDLGRTTYLPLDPISNHIGRYPIHMHHNIGPTVTPANGNQFTVIGNAVDGGSVETQFKWGIAVHDSHYGLIQDNVVYNYNGFAIGTEDGSESFNVFDHNFALRGIGEPDDVVSQARFAMGTEGVGFWFRGPNNYVRNNVAANFQNPSTEAANGYAYLLRYLGNVSIPNFKGADTTVAGQFTVRDGNAMPILQFENNEAYGAMQGGLTYWWVNSQDPLPSANIQVSLIKDLKLWHIYNMVIYHYPSQGVTFDGLVIRGKEPESAACCGNGINYPDYAAKNMVIKNSDIQGMKTGIRAPCAGTGTSPQLLLENTRLQNQQNLQIFNNGSVNGCWMENKTVEIRSSRFDVWPGGTTTHINAERIGTGTNLHECLALQSRIKVYSYNGNPNDNFEIFYQDPAVLPRPPSNCTPTTRPNINGLICPIPPLNTGNACDLNGSGVTDVIDVQVCSNQAIGIASCINGDINSDGQCNVVDVQRVVNNALGGQCVTQ